MDRESEGHWFVILDSTTGKNFYANPYIDVCTWKKPKNGKIMTGVLPEWWELYDSDTKMPYYFNTVTQQTHWKLPEKLNVYPIPLSSGDDKFLRRKLGEYEDDVVEETNNTDYSDVVDENKAEETVVKNWEQHEDPRTGYKYYLHRKTRKLTWSVIEAYRETMKEEEKNKNASSTKPSKPPPEPPKQPSSIKKPVPTQKTQLTPKQPPKQTVKFPNSFVKYSSLKKQNVHSRRQDPLPKVPTGKYPPNSFKQAPPPLPKTNKVSTTESNKDEKNFQNLS